MRLLSRAFVVVAVGFSPFVVTPRVAPAQTSYGVAGGLDFPRPISTYYSDQNFHGDYSPRFTIQAFVERQLAQRLGVRFSGSVDELSPSARDYAGIHCVRDPPPGVCCGICSSSGTEVHAVLQLLMSGVVGLTAPASNPRVYLLAGGGPAFVLRDYFDDIIRLSLSAGGGVAVPVGGRSRMFVEARFENLVNGTRYRSWVLPVSVGVQF